MNLPPLWHVLYTVNNRSEQVYDELLVLRCQDGDSEAIERLVKRWQLPVVNYANLITGDRDVARESVQEAWISVIRGFQRLKDPARFRQWLFRIVHNKCIDAMRRSESGAQPVRTEEGTRAQLDSVEAREEVLTVLTSLSEQHRAVLALFYLHDIEVRDIAEMLDLPEGTVKSRLYNAREAFRKVLEEEEGDHDERLGHKDRASA